MHFFYNAQQPLEVQRYRVRSLYGYAGKITVSSRLEQAKIVVIERTLSWLHSATRRSCSLELTCHKWIMKGINTCWVLILKAKTD